MLLQRRYKTDEKVTDEWVALDLLHSSFGSSSAATLHVWSDGTHEIRIDYWGREDHHIGTDSFFTTEAITVALKAKGYVEGTPKWGYTDQTELKISKRGTAALVEEAVRRKVSFA